jgi:hypothetical protein
MAYREGDFVFGFEFRHEVGTICGMDCRRCGKGALMWGANFEILPKTPLFIVSEATREDWERSIRKRGGNPPDPSAPLNYLYFYFVRTD